MRHVPVWCLPVGSLRRSRLNALVSSDAKGEKYPTGVTGAKLLTKMGAEGVIRKRVSISRCSISLFSDCHLYCGYDSWLSSNPGAGAYILDFGQGLGGVK